MKRRVGLILLAAGLLGLSLSACGGGSDSGSSALNQLINDNTPTNPGTPGSPAVEQPGTLGDLTDLGDLFAPDGDHWYYTRAAKINDAGTVIGQSNEGGIVKGAFAWDAENGMMSLGIHNGFYDDYNNIGFEQEDPRNPFIYSEAVDINQGGEIIGNSTTGLGWPDDQEKRAFLWKNGQFIDLVPPVYQVEGPVFDIDGQPIEGETALYTITGKYSEAVDINDQGEIVLTMDDPDGRHAYYWDGETFDSVDSGYYDANGPIGPVSVQVPRVRGLGRIVGRTPRPWPSTKTARRSSTPLEQRSSTISIGMSLRP